MRHLKRLKLKKEKLKTERPPKTHQKKVNFPIREILHWEPLILDPEEKQSLIKRLVVILILLALCISSFAVSQHIYQQSKNVLPNGIVLRNEIGMQYDFDAEKVEGCSRVGISQAQVTGIDPMIHDHVNLYYTEDDLPQYLHFEMISGAYFRAKRYAQQNRFVVISEEMAVRYFKTNQAVGLVLHIDEVDYTVCGVYRPEKGFLTDYASNGYDNIYLPYQSQEKVEELPVHLVLMDTKITEFTNAAMSALTTQTQKFIWANHVTGYPDLLTLMVFFRRLLIFGMGVAVIVLLCKRMAVNSVEAYHLYHMEDQQQKAIRYTVFAGIFLLSAVVVFLLVRFELSIPQSVLPENNIFDFGYYMEEWLNAIHLRNGLRLYDFHWNYSFAAMTVYSIWLLITAILYAVLFTKVVSLYQWLRKTRE